MNRLNTFAETVERAGIIQWPISGSCHYDQYQAQYCPWQEFKVSSASTQCVLFPVEPLVKSDLRNEIEDSCTSCSPYILHIAQTNPKSTADIANEFVLEYGRFSMGGVVWHCCANKIWEMNALWLHLRSSQVAPANAPGRISVWQRTELPFRVLAPAF